MYYVMTKIGFLTDLTENELTTDIFDAGTAISTICDMRHFNPYDLRSWLTLAGVVIDALDRIEEACEIYDKHAYIYLGGKEGTVYDPTECNDEVEVYSTWDEGELSLTWEYSGEYKEPEWDHTEQSTALMTDDETIADETIEIYNNNIAGYGMWKWGVGRLGY